MPGPVAKVGAPHDAPKGLASIFTCVWVAGSWVCPLLTEEGALGCAVTWHVFGKCPPLQGRPHPLLALLGQKCDVLLSPLPAAPFSLLVKSGGCRARLEQHRNDQLQVCLERAGLVCPALAEAFRGQAGGGGGRVLGTDSPCLFSAVSASPKVVFFHTYCVLQFFMCTGELPGAGGYRVVHLGRSISLCRAFGCCWIWGSWSMGG